MNADGSMSETRSFQCRDEECWHAGLVGVQTRTVRSVPAGPYADPSCIPQTSSLLLSLQRVMRRKDRNCCLVQNLHQLRVRAYWKPDITATLRDQNPFLCFGLSAVLSTRRDKGSWKPWRSLVLHLGNTNVKFHKQTGGNTLLSSDTEPDN